MKQRRRIPEWAIDRGYEPHPDDLHPGPPLPDDHPWSQAIKDSAAEVRRLREKEQGR